MSAHDDDLSRDAEHARAALTALAEAPAASAALRARLKREFASGEIERTAALRAATDTLAPHAPEPQRPHVVALPRRRVGEVWRWVAAAAAVLVAGYGAVGLNAGPAWRLVSATGQGVATVDGRPVAMNHVDELMAALAPGARVRVPAGCRIEIASARTLAIQMVAETDATVPPVPGRWFRRDVSAEIRSGEWRITTGPAFTGARLALTTPSARVEVTGTTLAVICEPQGTCVCVFEGRVRVGRDRTDMVMVEHGHRRFLFVDEQRAPESAEMRPAEAGALPAFQDSMSHEMSGGR